MAKDAFALVLDRELFSSWTLRNAPERTRERRNWGMYDATEFRQWDDVSLRIMIQEGRPPHSFNFIKRDVDTLAGASLADPYDIHYETEIGEKNDISILFNELYLEDRDMGHFMFQYLQSLRAGFVYRGWLEMYKDYSRVPQGRVGLRYLPPDQVVTDPDWTTNDVKDNKALYIPRWMSPQQIKDKYKTKSDILDSYIEIFKLRSGSGDRDEIDKLFDRSAEFWDEQNNLFLVWDKMEMVKETKTKLWDFESGTWVPDTDGDHGEMLEMARFAGRHIEPIETDVLTCKVYSQCPALVMELQDGNHPLQLDRYPLFCFSSDCINGRPNTPVDQLKDWQEAFNKRESIKTHILQTLSTNFLMVESDTFDTPEKAHDLIKHRNRPGGGAVVEPGANKEGKVKNLDRPAAPTEFMNDLDRLLSIRPMLTPAVPAISGIGEEGESGILFQSKVAQAQIGMQIPAKMLLAFWHQVGDAYFMAAQQTYVYPMVFRSSRTNQIWYLNYEGGLDMKSISRMRVTVTQSPSSETYRRLLLQTYMALSQSLPSPLSKQALSRLVIQTLPNVPDEEKAELAKITQMEEEYQKKVVMLQTLQIDMQISALTMQAQAAQAMPQGMPGQPGPMAPGPASPAPVDTQALMAQIMGNSHVRGSEMTQTA